MPDRIHATCPNCHAVLTVEHSVDGNSVRCSDCSAALSTEISDDDVVELAELDDASDDEDTPQPRPEPKKSRDYSTAILIGGCLVVGLIMFAVVVLIVNQQIAKRNKLRFPEVATNPAPQQEITDAACEELGKQMQVALASGETQQVSILFDWNEFSNRCSSGLGLSPKEKAGFARGVTTACEGPNGLIGKMVSQIGSGTVKFVRVIHNPAGKRILVRVLFEDGTSNYTEWVLARNAAGQLKFIDGYSYLTGELLTVTIRRMTVPVLASLQPSLMDKLSGADREAAKHLKQIQQLIAATNSNQPQQVLEVYNRFPDSLKRERAMLLHRMAAALKVNDSEYQKVLEDFQKYFPNDVSLDFVRLDYWALKNDSVAVVAAIHRLEAAMGGVEAHLHGMMALHLLQMDKLAEARKVAQEAMELEPELSMPCQALVSISLKEKNYDEVLQHLKLLFETNGLEYLEMETDEDFAGFIKSPQFELWKEYRSEKATQ